MSKKIKLEVTEAQLRAIVEITNDISAMTGCGDNDSQWVKNIKLVDRALNNNGYKRQYK